MHQNDLVSAAIEWADNGIPVFPCNAKKKPLTTNGLLDATYDHDTIASMFANPKAVFIGGRMGGDSGLFVIDVDLYKGEEPAQFVADMQQRGLMPDTRVHETMRGGLHYFYEGKVASSKPSQGVEVKGDGGYIILPPSEGYSVKSTGVVAAPPNLLEFLEQGRAARKMAGNDQLRQNILDATDFHDSITQLAARLASQGKSNVEVQSEIMAALNASVAASPHHERHERWKGIVTNADGELSRIVKSGDTKFNHNSASNSMAESVNGNVVDLAGRLFTSPSMGEHPTNETYSDEEWPFTGQGYFAHEEHDLTDQKFTMYPIYAEDETVVLFAEPKTGKTALALTTALHVACGIDLGPFKVTEAGPCLYYGLEGTRAIRLRVESWKRRMKDKGIPLPDNIPMFTVEKTVNFLKEENRVSAANQIIAANNYSKRHGMELKAVFLDTLTKAMAGGDQNSVEDTSHLFELVGLLRTGGVRATIVFVHHKSRQGALRGSTNIEAEPDVLLDINKEGGTVTMKIARARSIEDGIRFHFTLHGYDLGTTKQGHKIQGLYIEPVEGDITDASDDMVAATTRQKQLKVITNFGVGTFSIEHVVEALDEAQLLPKPASRLPSRKSKPSPKAAYLQKFFAELIPEAGTPYADYMLRREVDDGKTVAIKIGEVSY